MDALFHFLREFPAAFMVIGAAIALVGTALWWLTFGKRVTPLYAKTITDMAKVHELQIASHERTLAMQKSHYELEMEEYKGERERFRKERDEYKTSLHAEKENHQATLLQLAEVQARPNLDQVYKGQQQFFTSMIQVMEKQQGTMQAIHKSIIDHDAGIEARAAKLIEPVKQMCQQVAAALEAK